VKVANMELILCIFKKLTSLKINFHRSVIFCFGKAKNNENIDKKLFAASLASDIVHMCELLFTTESFAIRARS
jgi:hypothetical protein